MCKQGWYQTTMGAFTPFVIDSDQMIRDIANKVLTFHPSHCHTHKTDL